MFTTRLLLHPKKAATGWAVLTRRNGTVPALPSSSPFPYCAALARRSGTAPALPSCFSFPYRCRNGTAPALPSVSPSPYCISFFIGPRHMSSNGRRAFLPDRIALRLEAEGIPYTEVLNKIINEFLDKKLEDVDQSFGSEGEMQKEHHLSLLKRENEKLIRDIEKMHSELRYEIDKVTTRRLDLNLERGIALRPEAEGIPYTEALDKIINEFLNKKLEDVDQSDSEGEMQKDSKLDKIQLEVQSSQEHRLSLLKCENEKLIRDIEKMHSELRYKIDKVTARRLDLNLERGRIHDERAKHYAEITDLITKLDQEIHTLRAQWELQNTR